MGLERTSWLSVRLIQHTRRFHPFLHRANEIALMREEATVLHGPAHRLGDPGDGASRPMGYDASPFQGEPRRGLRILAVAWSRDVWSGFLSPPGVLRAYGKWYLYRQEMGGVEDVFPSLWLCKGKGRGRL